MDQYLDLSGLERLIRRLARIAPIPDEDMSVLMEEFAAIVVEDNRKGILEGTDKDGNPMKPVSYRPVADKTKFPGHSGGAKKTKARPDGSFGTGSGAFKGAKTARFGNLTLEQYKKLDGPPLAPRYDKSRVITNLKVGYQQVDARTWEAVGLWDQVLDQAGQPFLMKHFTGATVPFGKKTIKLPVRDLRGVRPWGRQQARRAVRLWIQDLLSRQL
jgi:hypothetical protein